MTATDRPSVTDNARAVREAAMNLYRAMRRTNPDAWAEVDEVEDWAYWDDIVRTVQVTLAAGRAETVGNDGLTDAEREEYARQYRTGPAFQSVRTPLNAGRAETTTEAVERIARQIARETAMGGVSAREYVEAIHALYQANESAETTTATDEDAAQVLRAHFWDASDEQLCTCGESPTGYDGDQDDDDQWLAWANWHTVHVAQALHARGLLATARTRPTREQIIEAIGHDGEWCKPERGPERCCDAPKLADAVLALLTDQPDPADIAAQARADLLAYLIDGFNRQHAQVAVDTPEEGYSGLSWHEWADGTRNGMEKLIYTVRYLAEHPEYTERAARLRGGDHRG